MEIPNNILSMMENTSIYYEALILRRENGENLRKDENNVIMVDITHKIPLV